MISASASEFDMGTNMGRLCPYGRSLNSLLPLNEILQINTGTDMGMPAHMASH
jgi:hypothetical protein